MFILAVVTAIVTVLAILSPETPRERIPFWIAVPVVFLPIAFAFRWASRGMRFSNPWAFAVGLAVSVFAAWVSISALGNAPVDSYDAPVLRYITIALWGLSSLFAILGLLYSLVSVEEVPPPAEPSSDAG